MSLWVYVMKIAIIVSSNIVKDPRVVKQAEVVKDITDDYIVIGKWDENATKERIDKLKFSHKLLKSKNVKSFVKKAITRIIFGIKIIRELNVYMPDIIHANDFDMLFFAYFTKKKNQILIYDAHEIYAKNGLVSKFKVFSNFLIFIEKRMMRKVDYFITVSYAAKDYYISNKYSVEPLVITNVPIKTEFNVLDKHDKFEALYQGIVSPNRGYEEFAKSANYTDAIITIRGYGPSLSSIENIKEQENLINLNIEKPVEMEEMIKYASRSHVGIVMTKPVSENYEYTVSNKIFEYIQAGIPVIMSPVKEHKYLNEKYKIGLVVDQINEFEIAKAINLLKEDKDYYDELVKNVKKASKVLNWQIESELLKKIYINEI